MTPKGVRLADPDWMCDPSASDDFADHGKARLVFSALEQGFMPSDKPLPEESLDLYRSWMTGGFQP